MAVNRSGIIIIAVVAATAGTCHRIQLQLQLLLLLLMLLLWFQRQCTPKTNSAGEHMWPLFLSSFVHSFIPSVCLAGRQAASTDTG